jgi:hypothetical protein
MENKKMKSIALAWVVALSSLTYSLVASADGVSEGDKANALKNLDARISKLQELRSCVAGATTRDATKACHKAHEAWADATKAENRARHSAKIDENIKKLQEKKAKLDAQAHSGSTK